MQSRFLFSTVLFLFVAQPVFAQAVRFEHVKTHVFDTKAINLQYGNAAFGGISAMEFFDSKFLSTICGDCIATPGPSLLLFSDKRFKDKHNIFQMSHRQFVITTATSLYNMADVESVRYNAHTGLICYSYEGDTATGVFVIDAKTNNKKKILEMPLPTNNRGIEGLAFASDNSLWIALETGGPGCADKAVSFYRIEYEAAHKTYNGRDTIAYHYPLDKCACLDADAQNIDGSDGNGVTEILSIKDMPGRLLVLERCFNRKTRTGSTYLYLATINEQKRLVTKDKMLFDFTANDFPNAGRNIEGMCWADATTLLLVADDNFSEKQVGLVVELKLVR